MKSLIMTALVAVTVGPLSSVSACIGAVAVPGQPTPKCGPVARPRPAISPSRCGGSIGGVNKCIKPSVMQAMSYRRYFTSILEKSESGLTVSSVKILAKHYMPGKVAEKCTKKLVVSLERSDQSVIYFQADNPIAQPKTLVQCFSVNN